MKTTTQPQAETKLTSAQKELNRNIAKVGHYSLEQFEKDAAAYVAAIRSGRMLCVIESVSRSGMSRTMKFNSCEGKDGMKHYYRQYNCLFIALGFRQSKNRFSFVINGCGMDMVFHTNYTIIHNLHSLGLITKDECSELAQQTPTVL